MQTDPSQVVPQTGDCISVLLFRGKRFSRRAVWFKLLLLLLREMRCLSFHFSSFWTGLEYLVHDTILYLKLLILDTDR
jgi:hypothetical protein